VVYHGTGPDVASLPVGGTQDAIKGYALEMRKTAAAVMLKNGFADDFLRHCWVLLKRSLSMPIDSSRPKTQTIVYEYMLTRKLYASAGSKLMVTTIMTIVKNQCNRRAPKGVS